MRGAQVVGVVRVRGRAVVARGRRCRRHPAVAVHLVVVGAAVARMVDDAREVVVGGHGPCYRRHPEAAVGAEPQVLRRVVHAAGAVEPDALQVYGHVYLLARVGVVAVDPQLVECRVDPLGPHLVEEHVGLYLVVVAAVDHQFALAVEVAHRAFSLAAREVEHRCGVGRHHGREHNCYNCNAFHRALAFICSLY